MYTSSLNELLTTKKEGLILPALISGRFNPSAEFAIPIGIPTKEAKAEIEIQPVIATQLEPTTT